MLLSSLIILSGCSMPVIALHPEYPVKPEHIVGRWVLLFNATDPPIHDMKTHKNIGTPDYEILEFKKDGSFSLEFHSNNKNRLVNNSNMTWKITETTTYSEGGAALLVKHMRYYPSVVLGSDKSFRNNPDELILEARTWLSDLYICFETVDMDEVCFSRETPWKKRNSHKADD